MHIEIITANSTASAAAGSTAVATTGDSLITRNGRGKISIVSLWSSNNTNAGFAQIVFPSGHDTTRGYRGESPAGPIATANSGGTLLPLGYELPLDGQEQMQVTLSGNAVAGDVDNFSMLLYYENFPGINARLIDAAECDRRLEKMTTVESSVADAGTGLTYNEEAITVDSDLLRANRDYAVLGISGRTAAHAYTLFSPDLGNVRVGVPGNLRSEVTSQYFSMLSRATGLKTIPVINSGNKTQTLIGFKGDENGAARVVCLHLALLK